MRKLTRWELEDLGTALTAYGATVRRSPAKLTRLLGLLDLFGLHRPGWLDLASELPYWCRPRRSHKLHRFGTYIGDGKWSACRSHGIKATEGQPRIEAPLTGYEMCKACLRRSPDDLRRIG